MIKKTRLFKFAAALGLLSALLVVPAQGWAQAISAGASAAAAGPHLGGETTISAHNDEQYAPSGASSNLQGYITFSLNDGTVYRIQAEAGATPENISTALDGLSAGGGDVQLNSSPNGQWLALRTERFHADCVGWDCLALVNGDLSAGEAVLAGGAVIHPEGMPAVSNDGDLIVYPATGGPHAQDLFAVRRTAGVWDAPVLLTTASTYAYHDMPALSADGSKVLMDCSPESWPSRAICEVDTTGTGFRTVLDQADSPPGLPDTGALHHPDYAADGSILFEGDWGGELIWRLPVGESVPVRVNASYTNDNSPCVLPDGRIASLWLNRPGGPGYHEIKIMDADGSNGFVLLLNVDVSDVGLGCGMLSTYRELYLPLVTRNAVTP